MTVTNATINKGVQHMNLTNSSKDNVQYMNPSNLANDDVRYVNLLHTTNNNVRYKNINVSNPMAPHDGDKSNDKHQGKSDRMVSVATY